jgi:c-di-GMP-related signal transduction protein
MDEAFRSTLAASMSSTTEQDIPPADTAARRKTGRENTGHHCTPGHRGRNRAVYGYELFDRSTASDAHRCQRCRTAVQRLVLCGHRSLVGKKTVFINCTHESLAGGHLELIHPDKVVLEVPPLPDSATQEEIEARVAVLQALRKRGFRLAFNQNVLAQAPMPVWLPLAGFIKLDMQAFKPELAGPLVKFASTNSQATLVAEKVETAEQYQLMADLGVKLFQGYWFASPRWCRPKPYARRRPPSSS